MMLESPDNPVALAVIALQDACLAEYEAQFPKGAKWTAVRGMSRALAIKSGFDPDHAVMGGGRGYVPGRGPHDSIALRFPLAPAWALYVPEVMRVVDMLEVEGLLTWPS